jgi:hypothetical protein
MMYGLGLDASGQKRIDGYISKYLASGQCDQLATLTDTFRRLSNKTEKSSSTRVAAAEAADQLGAAYVQCMASKGQATAATGTASVPVPVQQAPTGIIDKIANVLAPQSGIGPQPVTTPEQDNTMRYLIIGGIGLAAIVGGVWLYSRYKKGK